MQYVEVCSTEPNRFFLEIFSLPYEHRPKLPDYIVDILLALQTTTQTNKISKSKARRNKTNKYESNNRWKRYIGPRKFMYGGRKKERKQTKKQASK